MSKLYVVATPIGNLDDLTERVRRAFELSDIIAAEDTRVTVKLLNHFGIKKPLVSCHRHNESDRAPDLISRMQSEDITVALACDAGTPGISDPGHILVKAAWEAGIPIEPVSGPSAVCTALSVSGFDAREFAFYGFLPREKKQLKDKLREIERGKIDIAVIYESPHRVVELMRTIYSCWPDCEILSCCDLTKKFEKLIRGGCGEVLKMLEENTNTEKGEYCIVAHLKLKPEQPAEDESNDSDETYILSRMLNGDKLSAACEAAISSGRARNGVYRAKLRIKNLIDNGY